MISGWACNKPMTNQEVATKKGAQKVRAEIDKDNRKVPLWTCGGATET